MRNLVINGNGAVFGKNSEIKRIGTSGDKVDLPVPARTGYKFMGWQLTGSGSVTGNKFIFGNGDSTVSAKWAKVYEIKINITEPGYPESIYVKRGITGDQIKLEDPVLKGMNAKFNGWKHSGNGKLENGVLTIGTQNEVVTANITHKYFVIIILNGGQSEFVRKNGGYIEVYSDKTINLGTPYKPDFDFVRWTVYIGEAKVEGNRITNIRSNIYVKAEWRPIK